VFAVAGKVVGCVAGISVAPMVGAGICAMYYDALAVGAREITQGTKEPIGQILCEEDVFAEILGELPWQQVERCRQKFNQLGR
jgi:hypothetical protein